MLFDVNIFSSLFSATDSLTLRGYLICMAVSLILGIIIAACNTFRNRYTKSLTVTLVLLPVIVQAIIAMVNGQLGAGIAVAGAFSLIRFRSAPAQARDITSIFLAMSVGLATGMGYIGIAILLTIVVCVANIISLWTIIGSSMIIAISMEYRRMSALGVVTILCGLLTQRLVRYLVRHVSLTTI